VTLTWPRAYIVHVGDSRCYYLRHGTLHALTRDQTIGEELIDAGVMSEEQVSDRGLDHLLTSAVGADINPVLGLIDLEWEDVLLMCTDGLTKHVSDDRIAAIIGSAGTAREIAEKLVDEALAGGGTDNVTVIVGRMIQ
jgi:protein phosphatase